MNFPPPPECVCERKGKERKGIGIGGMCKCAMHCNVYSKLHTNGIFVDDFLRFGFCGRRHCRVFDARGKEPTKKRNFGR